MKKIYALLLIMIVLMSVISCGVETQEPVSKPTPKAAIAPAASAILAPTAAPNQTHAPKHTEEPFVEIGKVELDEGFYYIELNDVIKKRITGMSYPAQDSLIGYDDLRYIKLLHYNFDGAVCEGEMIVHATLADEVMEIFYQLYSAQYPLASVRLVDDFDADDTLSMQANNTSAFNYRYVTDSDSLSLHSYGAAIDINPMLNPYVEGDYISPQNGIRYADRSQDFEGKIDKNDLCYRLFTERGWKWGGNWRSYKDYHHFFKDIR